MDNKKKSSTFYVVLVALFSALVCALTYFVPIPILAGNGYINFGDALIFLAASLLGPIGGAIAGAVGSSLADLMLGFAAYAPFTFLVKGGEGFLCGILYAFVFKDSRPILRRLFSTLIAGAWMIVGYFLTDLMLYGPAAAVWNFVSGPIQAGVSIVIALVVMPRIPVLFASVKQHTENDDEELYEEEMRRKREAENREKNDAVSADSQPESVRPNENEDGEVTDAEKPSDKENRE